MRNRTPKKVSLHHNVSNTTVSHHEGRSFRYSRRYCRCVCSRKRHQGFHGRQGRHGGPEGCCREVEPCVEGALDVPSMVSYSSCPCCDFFCLRIMSFGIFFSMRTPLSDASREQSSLLASKPKFYPCSTMILWNWPTRLSGEATKPELLDSCAILKSSTDVSPWLPLWVISSNPTESTFPGP